MSCPRNEQGFLIIHTDENPYKIALNIETNRKTLIICKDHDFIPDLNLILALKDSCFIVETTGHFKLIKNQILNYQTIILVDQTTKNFEKEFYNQVSEKMNKKMVLITSK